MKAFTESCDGADLDGKTCADFKLAGGTLRCGSWCGFDTRACLSCTPSDRLLGCGVGTVRSMAPTKLALAATDDAIGVAWITQESKLEPRGTRLRFARFHPDLTPASEEIDLGEAADRGEGSTGVALAATGSGWLVAADVQDGMIVRALDVSGAPRGDGQRFDGGSPVLASRPKGGPLLALTAGRSGDEMRAVLLRPDGAPEHAPAIVSPSGTAVPGNASAVFSGAGFLVATVRHRGELTNGEVVVTRIALDGRVAAVHVVADAPVGTHHWYPSLAWAPSGGGLSFLSKNQVSGEERTRWVELDRTGAVRSKTLAPNLRIPDHAVCAPFLTGDGDHVVALVANSNASTSSLSVASIDFDGHLRAPPTIVAHEPSHGSFWRDPISSRVVRRGPDLVVAWPRLLPFNGPGGVGLARLRP
ncbi:Hypothetical protein A7982_02405 [Minicystis rosea]|nr:Hypothetical protein A7982_02405 [Minicystis rosea]